MRISPLCSPARECLCVFSCFFPLWNVFVILTWSAIFCLCTTEWDWKGSPLSRRNNLEQKILWFFSWRLCCCVLVCMCQRNTPMSLTTKGVTFSIFSSILSLFPRSLCSIFLSYINPLPFLFMLCISLSLTQYLSLSLWFWLIFCCSLFFPLPPDKSPTTTTLPPRLLCSVIHSMYSLHLFLFLPLLKTTFGLALCCCLSHFLSISPWLS